MTRRAVMAALLLAGCPSTERLVNGVGGRNDRNGFIAAFCDLHAPCCGKTGASYDPSRCVAWIDGTNIDKTYDPNEGAACLDKARDEGRNPTFCTRGLTSETRALCTNVFVRDAAKKSPVGESCKVDSDCASASDGVGTPRCKLRFGSTSGRCEIFLGQGDAGARCEWESGEPDPPPLFDCPTPLFCNSQTNACDSKRAVGAACEYDVVCDSSAYCDRTTSVCTARKKPADECTPSVQSGSYGTCDVKGQECPSLHYCDPKTKRCLPRKVAGATCVSHDECQDCQCMNDLCTSVLPATGTVVCEP